MTLSTHPINPSHPPIILTLSNLIFTSFYPIEYLRNSFGYDVWQDDDEALNSDLVNVKDCLENCICVIVCVSKLYMSRLKCKKEVKRAHDLKSLKKLRVFYVFMQDDFTHDSHPHHVDGQVITHR